MTSFSWGRIRVQVYQQANGCCEYCHTCEINTGQTMQVDHIDPQDEDELENLCLACWNCNSSKHRAVSAFDPQTNEIVALFNPRQQQWSDHFEWIENAIRVQGKTPTGRATIERLKMNRPRLVIARLRWVKAGYHPPE